MNSIQRNIDRLPDEKLSQLQQGIKSGACHEFVLRQSKREDELSI